MKPTQLAAGALALAELTKSANALDKTPHYSEYLPPAKGDFAPRAELHDGVFTATPSLKSTRRELNLPEDPRFVGLPAARVRDWFNGLKGVNNFVHRPPAMNAGYFTLRGLDAISSAAGRKFPGLASNNPSLVALGR